MDFGGHYGGVRHDQQFRRMTRLQMKTRCRESETTCSLRLLRDFVVSAKWRERLFLQVDCFITLLCHSQPDVTVVRRYAYLKGTLMSQVSFSLIFLINTLFSLLGVKHAIFSPQGLC